MLSSLTPRRSVDSFVASSLLYKIFLQNYSYFAFPGNCTSYPFFYLNNLRVDAPFPNVTNPFSRIGDFFFSLLTLLVCQSFPLRFEILYEWEALIVPMAVLLCTSGLYIYVKQNDKFVIPSEAETDRGIWIVCPDPSTSVGMTKIFF